MFDSFRKFLDSIVLFQTLLLMMFLLFNFDSLRSIELSVEVGDKTFPIKVDLLASSIITLLVFVTIIVLASLNILGSGLSELGISAIAKFVALLVLFAFFLLAEGWLFQSLSFLGSILLVFFRFADIMYFITALEK